MTPATIYGFSPAFGLPTSGPFALKLLCWCALNGVPSRGNTSAVYINTTDK